MPHDHDSGEPVVPVYAAYVPDHDHDHDDEPVGSLEDDPVWQQDNVTLHSVGMDIGSSGTQVVFSPAAPAPHRRGPDQPLRRGRAATRSTARRSR